MKLNYFISLCLLATLAACGQTKENPVVQVDTASKPSAQLVTVKDSLSWAYGQYLALALKGEFFDTAINHELALQAFNYTLEGGTENLLPDEQAKSIYKFVNMYYSALMQHKAAQYAKHVDSLQHFFFVNLEKTHPDIHRFDMKGIPVYYEVLKAGKGPNAKYAQRIKFDYRSFKLFDNEPIDQTYGVREPIVHVVGNPMFPALIEAFMHMNAGSIYRFYFPYQVAFGAEGADELIPPYTPVIYEIELHELYDI